MIDDSALLRRGAPLLCALALLLTLTPSAHAQDPARGVAPEHLVLREGEFWVRPILEVRERGELRLARYERDAFTGQRNAVNRYRVNHRIRAGLDARWRMVRAYAVVRDARVFGDTTSTLEGGGTDLHQAFAEVAGDVGWLRVGRQEIRYGAQRLIGGRMFGAGQAFDAVRGHLDLGEASIDAFGAWISDQPTARVDPTTGEPVLTPGELLAGTQLTYVVSGEFVLQPQVFYRYQPPPATGGLADQHSVTAALRFFGRSGVFRYDLEPMVQLGTDTTGVTDVSAALAGAGWVGIAMPGDAGFEARLGGSFGTGQAGSFAEFDNLRPFSTNHRQYGILDNVSLSNAGSAMLRFAIAPRGTNVRAFIDGYVFASPEPGQTWSGQDGRVLSSTGSSSEPLLGGEVDLVARWRPDPSLLIDVAYGIFIPGPGAAAYGYDEVSQLFLLTLGVRLP